MPRMTEAAQFERTLSQLLAKREAHMKGLAEIDSLCAKFGITLPTNGSRTPLPAPRTTPSNGDAPSKATAAGSRRRRRWFDQSADEFVLSLAKGSKGITTGGINAAWHKSGRGGKADNTLTKLVKEKKLHRSPLKEGRGSAYTAL